MCLFICDRSKADGAMKGDAITLGHTPLTVLHYSWRAMNQSLLLVK